MPPSKTLRRANHMLLLTSHHHLISHFLTQHEAIPSTSPRPFTTFNPSGSRRWDNEWILSGSEKLGRWRIDPLILCGESLLDALGASYISDMEEKVMKGFLGLVHAGGIDLRATKELCRGLCWHAKAIALYWTFFTQTNTYIYIFMHIQTHTHIFIYLVIYVCIQSNCYKCIGYGKRPSKG